MTDSKSTRRIRQGRAARDDKNDGLKGESTRKARRAKKKAAPTKK